MEETQQGATKWQKHFAGCKQGIAFSLILGDMSFARR
jgi:hypothetical protein